MSYRLTIVMLSIVSSMSIDDKIDQACQFVMKDLMIDPDSSSAFVVSIAAPELIRYQELVNLMEVNALRLLYAELGSDKVDFSVGYFQIKPSFIEALEHRLGQDQVLKDNYAHLLHYPENQPSIIRQIRIERILDPCLGMDYLKAFMELMQKTHEAHLACLSTRERLHFLATSYNLGFGTDINDITHYQQQQNFPYGSGFQGEQYAFGTLSVRIYDQLNNMLCALNF